MEATQAIPIFLALEPDDATRERIWRYKRRVRALVGDQLYLDHPPHLTCFLAAFGDADEVIETTRRLVTELAAPAISVTGWHTFFADSLTGLNTLVMDFTQADCERLRRMQLRIVDVLREHRDEAASLDRINGRWQHLDSAQQAAARRYGFPYVGHGWHPHFTVASIRPSDWPTIERELLRDAPNCSLTCPRIGVYRLIDDQPELLESFELPRGFAAGRARLLPSRTAGRARLLPSRTLAPTSGSAGASPSREGHPAETRALKDDLIAAMWTVVDRHDWIMSATITGSFLTDETLAAISDIDLVVIVEQLTGPRFDGLQQEFTAALNPPLAERGLKLRINPTLGPRKLNDDTTAVLHLMLYSREAHQQHAINSPFTCLDWQRSTVHRKRSMADIYPVFGLQPHHFVSARRGIRDYLHDFERGVVSYREIECSADGCSESKREEPMTTRDRYEYAYHVMRFLMQNLLKLVGRTNRVSDGAALVEEYSAVFPRAAAEYATLFQELRWRKARRDFSTPIPQLDERLRNFVLDFESQFRAVFFETATRHVFFRHAPTPLNQGAAGDQRFLGRSDPDIVPLPGERLAELIDALTDVSIDSASVSPLERCRQTLQQLGQHVRLPAIGEDARLLEIDYGACEGLTVDQAQREHAMLFDDWQQGRDPRFPGGENTADVLCRLQSFLSHLESVDGNSLICTHNVVLRCLVGEGLGVPRREWHHINVPHVAPITVVQTRDYGWFIDLEESVERRLFTNFLYAAQELR